MDGIAYYQNLFDEGANSKNMLIQADIITYKNELNRIEIPVL